MSGTGKQAGFSLLEMLVVLAIVSVASMAAAQLFAPRPEAAMVRAARDTLAADLRRQRLAALSTGRMHGITLYEEGNGYRLLPQGSGIRLPEAMRLSSQGNPGVMFNPDGSSSGGHLRLRVGGVALSLTVEPLLGRITQAERS
ncbi:prepilin-type N-terminal cleavage/methylation domain-containing protein [Ferrovibrio sp.]|uniref:prepilin-type N-terminal cleavage/methylation domain-containing protein n=1 Tax=Ferrovibrio sp. TaxID=1917215 RepID=UPI003D0A6DE6